MTTDPKLVEAVARALLEYYESDPVLVNTMLTWDSAPELVREHYRKQARVALVLAIPLIERNALERAAGVAKLLASIHSNPDIIAEYLQVADAILALISAPQQEGVSDE